MFLNNFLQQRYVEDVPYVGRPVRIGTEASQCCIQNLLDEKMLLKVENVKHFQYGQFM